MRRGEMMGRDRMEMARDVGRGRDGTPGRG